jgi:hypothetical protein
LLYGEYLTVNLLKRRKSFFVFSTKRRSKYEIVKETGYDIEWKNDSDLITMSIFKEHSTLPPSRQSKMHVKDYLCALSGLDGDSPFGRVVRARTEKDPERIKNMSDWEISERSKWNLHLFKVRQEYLETLTEEERNEEKIKEDEQFRLTMKAALCC